MGKALLLQGAPTLLQGRGAAATTARRHCYKGPTALLRGGTGVGKFRHLPVVENGEVTAMLDITKFLYDAITRMEKAAEQGCAIAAAIEGVGQQWGNEFSGPHKFIENLRDQMFKPSLSTIITENASAPSVSPSDLVTVAAKKMREYRVNSVVVMAGNMLQGILTSKDLVWRVVARSLSPEVTRVEKVMSACPGCATLDTTILEALQSMQHGRFRHIPVTDKRGHIVACLDALQLTHAAISMVEGASGPNDVANTMVQKFWDSALAFHPAEDHDSHSEESCMGTAASDNSEGKDIPPHAGNAFSYKIEDRKGRVHRFSCVSESLDELVSAVAHRLGRENRKVNVNLMYNDDEGDRVLLATDSDLIAAIEHARSAGWKVLRLHRRVVACRYLDDAETMAAPPARYLSRRSCGRRRRGNRSLETLRALTCVFIFHTEVYLYTVKMYYTQARARLTQVTLEFFLGLCPL